MRTNSGNEIMVIRDSIMKMMEFSFALQSAIVADEDTQPIKDEFIERINEFVTKYQPQEADQIKMAIKPMLDRAMNMDEDMYRIFVQKIEGKDTSDQEKQAIAEHSDGFAEMCEELSSFDPSPEEIKDARREIEHFESIMKSSENPTEVLNAQHSLDELYDKLHQLQDKYKIERRSYTITDQDLLDLLHARDDAEKKFDASRTSEDGRAYLEALHELQRYEEQHH